MKLYLETSIWNFYYADDTPDKRDLTKEFFANLEITGAIIYISETVEDEIERADPATQEKLFDLIAKFSPKLLEFTADASHLANSYIAAGILTENSLEDARHAAIATLYEMDYLLSWNLKHLANDNKMAKINELNADLGYSKLILPPPEERLWQKEH